MSAPALALTPTPATATVLAPGIVPSPAGISYSALFSPLPQVSLFQSPARPTLPSEAAVSLATVAAISVAVRAVGSTSATAADSTRAHSVSFG
jgi:hypothetical protein